MQTQPENTTAETPLTLAGIAPVTPTAPDQTLLRQLDVLQRAERRVAALRDFLRDHHSLLTGLCWELSLYSGELRITVSASRPVETAALARLFPGEWQTGCESWFSSEIYRDWLAVRGAVTIRLCGAERIEPVKEQPQTQVF